MDRWRLGIYDHDMDYARSLGRFLRKRSEGELEIRTFADAGALEACLDEGVLDGILAAEDMISRCAAYPGVWTALLGDGSREEYTEKIPVIEKYCSAEIIWKRLLETGGAGSRKYPVRPEDSGEIIGIFSPMHSCGNLVFGLFVSRFLAGGGRTLFVTLDEFACLPEEIGGGQTEGELSELYYYYSQGNLEEAGIRPVLGNWGGAHWAASAAGPDDLYSQGKAYDPEFFSELLRLGGYRYLVLDLGSGAAGKESLFRHCSRLFLPEPE